MQHVSKQKLNELQSILTKMSLEVCCRLALPEFGVSYRDVSRAVRNSRLPMIPASFGRVLCRFASKTFSTEELTDIVAKLRLKLIATQNRTWHVVKLLEPISEHPVNVLSRALPSRFMQVLRTAKSTRNMDPEIQIVKLGDLIYISVQMTSPLKEGPVLYLATPPGESLALVSSLHSGLLKLCVQGLGYDKYEDACLNGKDIYSLLRIHNSGMNENADHLTALPDYDIVPCVARSGIDYTGMRSDEEYVRQIIGPNPPVLSKLTLTSQKEFFDPHRLNKRIKLSLQLNSENVAKSLQQWAIKGAISPTSQMFHIFHKIKSNKITIDNDK